MRLRLKDLRALQKGGSEGFLRKKVQEVGVKMDLAPRRKAYDELEMNVSSADLDPFTCAAAVFGRRLAGSKRLNTLWRPSKRPPRRPERLGRPL